MSLILAARSDKRGDFVRLVLDRLWRSIPEGPVLVKPNLVSHEPYPTTTHPELFAAVLEFLAGRELLVGDAAAADLLRPGKAIENHELTRIAAGRGLNMIDFYKGPMGEKTAPSGVTLEMSSVPFQVSALVSLPVLKTHIHCQMTGALKNHFGFLSRKQRGLLHFGRGDIHQAIASLHQLAPGTLFIVDAVETLLNANEVRHGGKLTRLGCLFAGTDPVALDAFGLTLLAEHEPKLAGKTARDIDHLRYAAEWGIGSLDYEVEWIEF